MPNNYLSSSYEIGLNSEIGFNSNNHNGDDYFSSSDNVNNYYDLCLEIGIESYIDADHSKLLNLDFEHSGHTGFASSKQLEAESDRAKEQEKALDNRITEEVSKLKLSHIVRCADSGPESKFLWEDWEQWQTN